MLSKILQALIVSVVLALPTLFAAHRLSATIDRMQPAQATVTVDHVALARAAFALAEANRPQPTPALAPTKSAEPEADPFATGPCDCQGQKVPCPCGRNCKCSLPPSAKPKAEPKAEVAAPLNPCYCSPLCTCEGKSGGECRCRTLAAPPEQPFTPAFQPMPAFRPAFGGMGGGRCPGGG